MSRRVTCNNMHYIFTSEISKLIRKSGEIHRADYYDYVRLVW